MCSVECGKSVGFITLTAGIPNPLSINTTLYFPILPVLPFPFPLTDARQVPGALDAQVSPTPTAPVSRQHLVTYTFLNSHLILMNSQGGEFVH